MAPKKTGRAASSGRLKSVATKPAPQPAAVEEPPLTLKEAESLLRRVSPKALMQLADSKDVEEQVPLRLALAYIGAADLSWPAAQVTVAKPNAACDFMIKLHEIDVATGMNRRVVKRMEEVGKPEPAKLKQKNAAAHVFATFFEVCLREIVIAEPPEWPMTIPFTDLKKRVDEAASWGRTALLICDGHAKEADTFFQYGGYTTIDAKWVIGKLHIEKSMSVEDMREELRSNVIRGIKLGVPLHIAMRDTAAAFKDNVCEDTTFPQALFHLGLWNDEDKADEEQEYKKIIRETDLEDWPGVPGQIKPGYHVVITSNFNKESAIEHLPASLPHIPDMAIIVIDSASFT